MTFLSEFCLVLKTLIPQATELEVSFIRVKTTTHAALTTIRLISK